MNAQKAVDFLLKQGFKPEKYNEKKQEISFALLREGYETDTIAEAVLDFQWIDATESDYEATRQENERLANEMENE